MNNNQLDQTILASLKTQLQTIKEHLENELSSFATRDPNVKGDWDTKFPRTPQGNLEEAADDVEEYSTRLHLEFSLENQLKAVDTALDKIEQGTYGTCEQCSKLIAQDRLAASPEARLCSECNKA